LRPTAVPPEARSPRERVPNLIDAGRLNLPMPPPSVRAAYAASFRSTFATITISFAVNGRWSDNASSRGAVSYVSVASALISITGVDFAWIGLTTEFASQVRNENTRCSPTAGLALVPWQISGPTGRLRSDTGPRRRYLPDHSPAPMDHAAQTPQSRQDL
jgi:hypothetical protein